MPVNVYMFSIDYPEEDLKRAGVERRDIQNFLVDETCLKTGLRDLSAGANYQAFRHLMFAWATHPELTWHNWKAYVLGLLLLLGPLAPAVTRALYRFYKQS